MRTKGSRSFEDPLVSLRKEVRGLLAEIDERSIPIPIDPAGIHFDEVVAGYELSLIQQALALTSGNQRQAADILRLSCSTLSTKIKKLKIDPEAFR